VQRKKRQHAEPKSHYQEGATQRMEGFVTVVAWNVACGHGKEQRGEQSGGKKSNSN